MDYYGAKGGVNKFPVPYSTSISIDPELDFDLSGVSSSKPLLSGPIHPFHKRKNNFYDRLRTILTHLFKSRENRKTLFLIPLNLAVIVLVKTWSPKLNSAALDGLVLVIAFDLMTLLISLTSAVQHAVVTSSSSSSSSVKGGNFELVRERRQMLLVFAALVFTMVGAVFVYKESIIRLVDQPVVKVDKLLPSTLLLLGFNFLKMALVKVKPLHSLCQASPSSLIQEHLSDMSTGLCHSIPKLSSLLLPRINPILVATTLSSALIFTSHLLIQIESFYVADTIASVLVATVVICSMWPLATSSGKILLNTLPSYVVGQLDKLLSEAQTLDGVLEIRNEKFYTIGLDVTSSSLRHQYGLVMCGSAQVRVRRDADPQMVLAHVTCKLAPLVQHLTIQVVKDEWAKTPLHHHHQVLTQHQATATRKQHHNSSNTKKPSKPIAAVAPYKPQQQQTARINDNAFAFASPLATAPPATTASSKAGDSIARMYRNMKHKSAFPLASAPAQQQANLQRWKK